MNDQTHKDLAGAKPIANPTLAPNKADISAHLYALFDQAFVHPYPDAWIEIAYGYAATGGKINAAKNIHRVPDRRSRRIRSNPKQGRLQHLCRRGAASRRAAERWPSKWR